MLKLLLTSLLSLFSCDDNVSGIDCGGGELDCNGECRGDAYVDNCGICNDDPNDDCVQDCNETWGGDAYLDICGICLGDHTFCVGCSDNTACNYNSNVLYDDGSCIVPDGVCESCLNGDIVDNDADDDTVCDADEITGCQISTACNYDPTATDDGNDTCVYPVCGLCEICDDLTSNTIYLDDNNQLWYKTTDPVFGFQLDLYGIEITSIITGDAQTSGLDVIFENGTNFSRILGYSTTSSSIESGCGNLLGLTYTGDVSSISEIIFGTTFGSEINVTNHVCP